MRYFKINLLALLSIAIVSCINKPEITETPPIDDSDLMSQLDIPEDFDFKTSKEVTISINDSRENTLYAIYGIGDQKGTETITETDEGGNTVEVEVPILNPINELLARGVTRSGGLLLKITLPIYIDQLLVKGRHNGIHSSQIVSVNSDQISLNGSTFATAQDITPLESGTSEVDRYSQSQFSAPMLAGENFDLAKDTILCVNGDGECFGVNPVSGELYYKFDLKEGSWTAAMDTVNNYLYTIGRKTPYKLYRYDLNDPQFPYDVVTHLGMGGPRLDYDHSGGQLIFSRRDQLYKIDPITGSVISSYTINGLHSSDGGDIAKDSQGITYLASFSGLYKLTYENDGTVSAERKSSENLPFTPTSMCIDSNDDLWLADSSDDGNLYIMDRYTGGYELKYTIPGHNINDLTTIPISPEEQSQIDTDGDGVPDVDDADPYDPTVAYCDFTPTKYGWGSIAFEDLWPTKGDYDFNDLVVYYRILILKNSDNEVVKIRNYYYVIHSTGASFINGFGISPAFLDKSNIKSVTGAEYSESIVSVDGVGLELGQTDPVIIAFDNSHNQHQKELMIEIDLNTPIPDTSIGEFNPFIFVNGDRGREVHLPYNPATDLAVIDNNYDSSGIHLDMDANYKTDSGLPWAISIIHEFRYPKEKVQILEAYNFFKNWAESGGGTYTDWYTDISGYRDENLIE